MGTRRTGLVDQRHAAVHLFGAVWPERDAAFGLILPIDSGSAMQALLDQRSGRAATGAHALLVMDRAGRPCADDPVMPNNITPVFLPPSSPGLDAIERLWLCLKGRFLSHSLGPDRDAIPDAVGQAWQRVTGEAARIRSLGSTV